MVVEASPDAKIVINENSWRFTSALGDDDTVLDVDLRAKEPVE